MNISHVFASIMTRDLEAASAWYERLFDRPADATPMDGLAEWHFKGSVLQLAQDEARAGTSSVTFLVTSRDGVRAELEDKGITAEPSAEGAMTAGGYFTTIRDPEGNLVTFAENAV